MIATSKPSKRYIDNSGYVFVLWADNFEELIATAFTTQLRKRGLRVKVVGLQGRSSRGVHGLTMAVDLTLEQAFSLVECSICIVIPCDKTGLQPFEDDPRLQNFLHQAYKNNSQFIVGGISKIELSKNRLLGYLAEIATTCVDIEAIITVAQDTATVLSLRQ